MRPSTGHDHAPRVEADVLGAVRVLVAEERVLPAGEGVERLRHGNRADDLLAVAVHVGIGQDDGVVRGYAQGLHALAVGGRPLADGEDDLGATGDRGLRPRPERVVGRSETDLVLLCAGSRVERGGSALGRASGTCAADPVLDRHRDVTPSKNVLT